jgi:hypothetical protein
MPTIVVRSDSSEEELREANRVFHERLIKGRLRFDETAVPERQPRRPSKKVREELKALSQAIDMATFFHERIEAMINYARALKQAYPLATPISWAAQMALETIFRYELADKTDLDDKEKAHYELLQIFLANLHLADVGIRPLSGGQYGHRKAYGTNEDKEARREAIRDAYDDIRKKNPELSKNSVMANTAKRIKNPKTERSISIKTVQRNCTDKK